MSDKQTQQSEPSRHNETYLETKENNAQLRKKFAQQLNFCVKRAYFGKVPSFATLSRDYSLRAKSDGPVSAETIRKWMHGISIPQAGRLHTLIQWLGIELAEVLNLALSSPSHSSGSERRPLKTQPLRSLQQSEYLSEDFLEIRISALVKKLSKHDRNVVLSMLEAFKKTRDGYHG